MTIAPCIGVCPVRVQRVVPRGVHYRGVVNARRWSWNGRAFGPRPRLPRPPAAGTLDGRPHSSRRAFANCSCRRSYGDWNTATSWVLDSLPRGLSPPAYWAGWTDRVTVVPVRHQCPAVKREVQVPTERRPSRPTPFALDSHHGQRAATQVTPYRPDRPPAPETGSVTGGPGSNTSRTLRRESCSRSREA
jgi:hypothetical protein